MQSHHHSAPSLYRGNLINQRLGLATNQLKIFQPVQWWWLLQWWWQHGRSSTAAQIHEAIIVTVLNKYVQY